MFMNIVIFSPSWPKNVDANGIVTYCDRMVSALRERGHQVFVLASHKAAGAVEDTDCVYVDGYQPPLFEKICSKVGEWLSPGFGQYYIGSKAVLSGIRKLEKTVAIDILEIEESFGWHYFLQKKVSFPIAMRLHGPHYINGTMGEREIKTIDKQRFKREERAFRAAKYVNAPCRWILDEPQDKYNIVWPVQAVFFNPLSVLPSKQCWSSSSYTPMQLLFVGRFDAHKGGDIVIQAFAQILLREPHATLVFAGPDKGVELASGVKIHIADAIKMYVSEGQKNQIRYIGLADSHAIKRLRKESHLTLMASRNENFPYSVIESLASAAPIIAPYVGGIREVFENDVSGVFFKGANIDDLTNKTLDLLQDKSKIEKIAQTGRQRCKDSFSPELIAGQAVDFYSAVIRHHAKQ
jgi:glycosyltransferase involved in cell wall biosynthesis